MCVVVPGSEEVSTKVCLKPGLAIGKPLPPPPAPSIATSAFLGCTSDPPPSSLLSGWLSSQIVSQKALFTRHLKLPNFPRDPHSALPAPSYSPSPQSPRPAWPCLAHSASPGPHQGHGGQVRAMGSHGSRSGGWSDLSHLWKDVDIKATWKPMSRMKGRDLEVTQFSSVISMECRHHPDPRECILWKINGEKGYFPWTWGKPWQQPSIYIFYLVTPWLLNWPPIRNRSAIFYLFHQSSFAINPQGLSILLSKHLMWVLSFLLAGIALRSLLF